VKLKEAFDYFDVDNTGYITEENLCQLMERQGKELSKEEIRSWISNFDIEKGDLLI
jgi:Ca2+-binding EF-hand superfamily protein